MTESPVNDESAVISAPERRGVTPAQGARGGLIVLSLLIALIGAGIAAWMAAGRSLFDAGGDMVPVFSFSILPAYAILQFVVAFFVLRIALEGTRLHVRTMVFLVLSWLVGFGFGCMVPDTVDGTVVSAFSQLFSGLDAKIALDFAIGFSNPLGIIAFALTVVAGVLAWVDSRGRRLPSRNPYENLS